MVKSGNSGKNSFIVHVGELDYNVKSGFHEPSRLRLQRSAAWALETLSFLLTIGLGFTVEDELSRSIVAVVTHVLFSTVTAGFVFWNEALPTDHTVKNAIKFWISYVFFLTKPFSLLYETRGLDCDEKLSELDDLEAKLKGSYIRLLFSFFTVIPSCFVQYYYLFQSGFEIIGQTRVVELVRIATIATSLFNTAACVYEYDNLTIEYEIQNEIEATNSLVEFRTGFWRYFMFICQRVTLTTYLLTKSPYFGIIYTISNFTLNYVILKHMPYLENSYVNVIHSTHRYWTFRIINIISGIGTKLNLDLINRYYCSLLRCYGLPGDGVWLVFSFHSMQLTFLGLYFTSKYFSVGYAVTNILVLYFYTATVVGDFIIDMLSCRGSVTINTVRECVERNVVEPLCDSRFVEYLRKTNTNRV